ncbi:MAG: aldo/keto reductase [Pseudomonadota bacterium]
MIDLPKLGMGSAPLGGLLDKVTSEDAAETLAAALEGGITYFDTAPFYGFGLSERRVGDALRGRDDVVLSSKVGRLLKPGPWSDPGAHGWPTALPFHHVHDYGYDGVMRSYEDSLQRLGLDRIDILFLHDIGAFTHPDPDKEKKHFEDAMSGGYRALDELRRAGDIKAIGIGVNEIDVSLRTLDHGEWDVFLLAGRYTLLEQDALADLFPKCARLGTKIIVGGPYNSGILVGGTTWNYAEAPPATVSRVAAIKDVCAGHNIPLPAAALQFCLAHPVVQTIIPGARTAEEIGQTMQWMKVEIPKTLWSELKSENLLAQEAPTPS